MILKIENGNCINKYILIIKFARKMNLLIAFSFQLTVLV